MQKQTEEQKLVKECLEGIAASQKLLFERYSGKMFAVCIRYVGDRDAAKDILQEGFIIVFEKLSSFRFEGPLEAWIRRIMVNSAIMHYRKEMKNRELLREDLIENHVQSIPGGFEKLKMQDLLNLISKLPLGYRTILNLFIIEGYSHQEIADLLDISVSTSKTQLRKARFQLMKQIEKEKERIERR